MGVSGALTAQATTVTNLNSTGITTTTLKATTVTTGSLGVSGTLTAQATSVTNLNASGITTGTLTVTGPVTFTDVTIANLRVTGTISSNTYTGSSLWISGTTSLQDTNAFQYLTYSDAKFKENIEELVNINGISVLDSVNKIKSYKYDMFGTTNNIGFIAQQLDSIGFDNLVKNENGYKTVNYTSFIPILAQANRELYEKVIDLTSDNKNIKARLEKLEEFITKL